MHADMLRKQAALAFRLAAAATDPEMAKRLKAVAGEFLREAVNAEPEAGRRSSSAEGMSEKAFGARRQGGSSQSGASHA